MQQTSMVFNIILLVLVLSGFGYFLYVQYTTTAQQVDEEKRIPFEPQVWYSATRNVRSDEYGGQLQPFETQTGYGIPGPLNGDGFSSVYGEYTSRAARD
jgi:hypothetical protein